MGRLEKICKCIPLFELDGQKNIVIIDIERFSHIHVPPFSPTFPVLVTGVRNTEQLILLADILEKVYPKEHKIGYIRIIEQNSSNEYASRFVALEQISKITIDHNEIYLYITPLTLQSSFEEFVEIIARLRDPQGGCPWDLKQTHQSLRAHLISESYEVLSALDGGDDDALAEELGDLLLQIVLHAQIASERGSFTITQVLEKVYAKIVGRHPHVFGDMNLEDVQGVLRNWEKIKEAERRAKQTSVENDTKHSLLDGVPLALPALIQAQEYLERTERIGLSWKLWHELKSEIIDTLDQLDQSTGEEQQQWYGKILFRLANMASIAHVDVESALREENMKFKNRLSAFQEMAVRRGLELSKLGRDETSVLYT